MPDDLAGFHSLSDRLRRLNEVSWSFDGTRSRSPFSGIHFHPARFISQLPSILISLLSNTGDLVLDPFCGSGTTLVEAQRLSRPAVGFDINPISVMISRAKTSPISLEDAKKALEDLEHVILRPPEGVAKIIPGTVQIAKWYSPDVALALAGLFSDIQSTADPERRLLKSFCFSSILIKVCKEDRHWGYICDNTTPKGSPPRDVAGVLHRAIQEIINALAARPAVTGPERSVRVVEAPAHSMGTILAPASVDLVVTSPPYFGVVDYVKAQRLSLEWFGADIESRRQLETGARSKRHRRYADSEFAEELEKSFLAIVDVMKPGAICAVVFGVSPSRGYSFDKIIQLFISTGLELQSDHVRDISVQRTLKPSVLTERLYVLTKPNI